MRLLGFFLSTIVGMSSVADPQDTQSSTENLTKLPFRISKETTFITAPLTANGFIDYKTYLNRELSKDVTPENNAAVFYLRALGDGDNICSESAYFERVIDLLGADPYADGGPYFLDFARFYDEQPDLSVHDLDYREFPEHRVQLMRPWKSKEHLLVHQWLQKNRVPLDRVLNGTRMKKHYSVLEQVEENDSIFFLVPLETLIHTEFATMLRIRATLLIGENRIEAAIGDALAIHRLARHSCHFTSIDSIGVAGLVCGSTYPGDLALANSSSVTAEQLLHYLSRLLELEPLLNFRQGLWAERLLNLDEFQRGCTTDPLTDSRRQATWDNLGLDTKDKINATMSSAVLKKIDCNEIMIEVNEFYDRIDHGLRHEYYQQRNEALQDFLNKYEQKFEQHNATSITKLTLLATPQQQTEHIAKCMLGWRARNLKANHTMATSAVAIEQLNILGIALSIYQKTKGTFPKDLEQLVPDYLPKIPLDPFNGKAIFYRTNADSAIIYSVGPNLEDDGGILPVVNTSVLAQLLGHEPNPNYDLTFEVKRTHPPSK